MSTYEKKLRILTALLLGGAFHKEVFTMAVTMFRISVVPDSTIQAISVQDLMMSTGGMVDAEAIEGGFCHVKVASSGRNLFRREPWPNTNPSLRSINWNLGRSRHVRCM